MKVILTGSTGFIGREVLKQCLANPEIDSSIVLSRRAIPDLDGNSKARVVIMEDFTEYTPEVLREIDGADASIWYACHIPQLSISANKTQRPDI